MCLSRVCIRIAWGVGRCLVPCQVDTFANDRGPGFSGYLVEANRSHVLELRVAGNSGSKLDDLVFEPGRGGSSFPDVVHMGMYYFPCCL